VGILESGDSSERDGDCDREARMRAIEQVVSIVAVEKGTEAVISANFGVFGGTNIQ
jgi:hypothetical protein